MIRINLLGVPRPKKGKRGGSMPTMSMSAGTPGEGPSGSMMLVLGLVLGLLAAGLPYGLALQKSGQLDEAMNQANQKGKELADVKVKYDQRQREFDAFDKRVKVIDQLREQQSGPVNLLNAIGNTVNATDAVWLKDMTEKGNLVDIEGTALSTVAVANLIANLKRSDFFKSVEIKSTAQDAQVKDMQAFNFVLTCEKKPAQPQARAQ